MSKVIAQNEEHRTKVKRGIDLTASLVGSTLGPGGANLILDRGFSAPIITNDGVSVARAIDSDDDIERQGIEAIRDVAVKTNNAAGDGTTTSIILAHAIVSEGMKYSEHPVDIRRSIQKASYKVLDELKKVSRPLKNKKEILQVATLSAESEEIGQIIADTLEAVGKDGNITVEQSQLTDIETKLVSGYQVEKGYVSVFMANKGAKAEYKNVHVLVIGDKLSTISELLPFLQKVSQETKDLVIFCTEIDPAVINTFLFNRQQGMFNTLVVKCPSQKNEVLEDVALVTGATFVSKEAGFKFEELDKTVLGKADTIIASDKITTIQKGSGSTSNKVSELKAELENCTDDNRYDLIENRIARLTGGVAVISVGAKTESDMQYLYYKVEDAVNATKAALEEGVVEGGGMTLYRLSQILSNNDIGEKILKASLHAPLRKIIENCGRDYTDILLNMPKGKGYDAHNDAYVDMFKAGIIDPAKVERCCIENAVSFASTFLTSKATIANVKTIGKEDE